ncbi:MAG: hypothetical protein SFY56_09715 [Bacteroidota bacterium]|nr:hypothetical protein [Bacteroidota bacterium]
MFEISKHLRYKKILAREILILFVTTAIFFLIMFIGNVTVPKSNKSFPKYIPTQWDLDYNKSKIEEYKIDHLANIEYSKNKEEIYFHNRVIFIIEIFVISFVYPIRILYFVTKWALKTLKEK